MADCAFSADARPASSGNSDDISAPSRRALLGAIVTAPLVAGSFATAANAGARDGAGTMNMYAAIKMPSRAAAWDAGDWMDRWGRLGCGLEVGGNALHLKGRLNGDREAIGAMMVEIAPAERQTAVIAIIEQQNEWWRPKEDPALRVVRELEAIDAEFISEDVDPAGNAAWMEKWDRKFDRLPWAPATTKEGWAAKLRYAIEYVDTPRGDKLMQQVLRHLELNG